MRLRMNKDASLDAITHGAVSYPISNSSEDFGVREVEVPDEVGQVLLRCSAGAVRIDLPEPEPDMTPMPMVAPEAFTTFNWRGKTYSADSSGIVMVPCAAMRDAISHNFTPLKED